MEPIIIRSKLKELVSDVSISKDYADALDKKVVELIRESVIRAKANQRNTIMPRDL